MRKFNAFLRYELRLIGRCAISLNQGPFPTPLTATLVESQLDEIVCVLKVKFI